MMGYQLIAPLVVAAHFLFLAYLAVGGFLAWPARWRWTALVHVLVVGWGVSIVTVGQECPLTWLENWARQRAGQLGLTRGFVDTYLTGVIYPARYLIEVRLLLGVVIAASWIGLALRCSNARAARSAERG
jgi:Protein of Unknown function (DUF2784)